MNDADPQAPARRVDWSAVAAIVATLVGLLALAVSAYTADLQRKQVRAQVWPRLVLAWSGVRHEFIVMNKGVGPALVGSVRFTVDGVAQRDWKAVSKALIGEPFAAGQYSQSTISEWIVAPGEQLTVLQVSDDALWQRFRSEMPRLRGRICFCSTLKECWVVDQTAQTREDSYRAVDRCERSEAEEFNE
ncbi:hypothetical protein [Tahibacter soli]|jgi:hypothetical protein|uniref:Uncharacterized protein n=1 Tax=Tahibacter soli TaxID=2983605 RepID=A0A9X4BGV7_9GAMM|nr:hypothetical protein [Tahibacter soli]MDC8011578.1 hypothetical protein [Tahibacter soli]